MKEIVFTDWEGKAVRARAYRHNVHGIAGIVSQLERGYVSQFGSRPGMWLSHTNRAASAKSGYWLVEGVLQENGEIHVFLYDNIADVQGKPMSQAKLKAICDAYEQDIANSLITGAYMYDPDDPA